MAKKNLFSQLLPNSKLDWAVLIADFLFPGSGQVIAVSAALSNKISNSIRNRVDKQSLINPIGAVKQSTRVRNLIDGTHSVYTSASSWTPGASNTYKLDVAENIHTKVDALVATLTNQSPKVDSYIMRGNLYGQNYFEVFPIIMSQANGGTFTPQTGVGNPMNPHTVLAASIDVEYRYILLRPFKSRHINQVDNGGTLQNFYIANFSFELKEFANAYLLRKQESEFSGDLTGKVDLYFLVVSTSVNDTINGKQIRHLMWHAK